MFGESNNNNIRHLYRKLYASDIDARRSSTAQLMKFVLKNLVSGNGNGIEPPIAKSNMIYMEAVDLLEKHTDVLQRESLEASGEFDMTLSLTENISRMMDGMMVRNRIAQKTINGYAMDHSDFVARQTRLGRQKNSFVTRLSRTSGTRKHSNLGLTSQSSLGQRSSYIQQSFWHRLNDVPPKTAGPRSAWATKDFQSFGPRRGNSQLSKSATIASSHLPFRRS